MTSSKYDVPLMETANAFANMSYCVKRKVGAVLSINGRPVSVGYNGTEPGADNVCEAPNGKTMHDKVIHAEDNAIRFAKKHQVKTNECTLHVTTAPCETCAGIIIDSGIKEVIYQDIYKNESGIQLLLNSGIIVRKL